MVYREQEIPEGFRKVRDDSKGYYYTLGLDDDKVTKIYINSKEEGIQNFSLNIIVLERELLIDLITEASLLGKEWLERDVLIPQLNKLNIRGYKYDGYVACISNIKTYFDENMKLLDDYNLNALFSPSPIYTKVRDDTPTRYVEGATVRNVMVADGCLIEGEVENSILSRGVKIAKGAKVKNCILMQDTVVEAGADIEYEGYRYLSSIHCQIPYCLISLPDTGRARIHANPGSSLFLLCVQIDFYLIAATLSNSS